MWIRRAAWPGWLPRLGDGSGRWRTTAMPALKSRKRLPSTSSTMAPSPRSDHQRIAARVGRRDDSASRSMIACGARAGQGRHEVRQIWVGGAVRGAGACFLHRHAGSPSLAVFLGRDWRCREGGVSRWRRGRVGLGRVSPYREFSMGRHLHGETFAWGDMGARHQRATAVVFFYGGVNLRVAIR